MYKKETIDTTDFRAGITMYTTGYGNMVALLDAAYEKTVSKYAVSFLRPPLLIPPDNSIKKQAYVGSGLNGGSYIVNDKKQKSFRTIFVDSGQRMI